MNVLSLGSHVVTVLGTDFTLPSKAGEFMDYMVNVEPSTESYHLILHSATSILAVDCLYVHV